MRALYEASKYIELVYSKYVYGKELNFPSVARY